MPRDPTKEKHMSTEESRPSVAFRVGLLIFLAVALMVAAGFQDIRRYLKIRSM